MRDYNTGLSRKVFASVLAAVVITAGILAIALYFPGGEEPTPPGPSSLGARTAAFLNSMRENVEFYFMCNSTFVNDDLSDFYAQAQPGAYVDGVLMNRTATGGNIGVLFSPWDSEIVGTGQISTAEWNSFSGTIIDDGIGNMDTPEEPPEGQFPLNWPITFYFSVFYDDNTSFFAGFSETDGYLYIQNGTWSGEFSQHGWPISTGWDDGYWLVEDGHLTAGINALFSIITTNVPYPE